MPQFTAGAMEKNKDLLELLHGMAREKQATPAQISLAWMMSKKPYIVPIPETRKFNRMAENAGTADILLTEAQVKELDEALDSIEMSEVFGGSVIDCCKIIAAQAVTDEDIWEMEFMGWVFGK